VLAFITDPVVTARILEHLAGAPPHQARTVEVIRFRPAAAREFAADFRYYEKHYPGRGVRFVAAVDAALAQIAAAPVRFAILYEPDIRSAKVKRCPYRVVHLVVENVHGPQQGDEASRLPDLTAGVMAPSSLSAGSVSLPAQGSRQAAHSTYGMLIIEGVGRPVGVAIAELLLDRTEEPELRDRFAGVVEHYRAHPISGLPLR
jgi:hypothetical protein